MACFASVAGQPCAGGTDRRQLRIKRLAKQPAVDEFKLNQLNRPKQLSPKPEQSVIDQSLNIVTQLDRPERQRRDCEPELDDSL